jgi:hypothetical protein
MKEAADSRAQRRGQRRFHVRASLRHKAPVPLARRPLLNLPIALLKVLDGGASNYALLILGQRPAHPAD